MKYEKKELQKNNTAFSGAGHLLTSACQTDGQSLARKKKIGILINGWLFIPADRVSIFSFSFPASRVALAFSLFYLRPSYNSCTNWLPFTSDPGGYNHRSNRFLPISRGKLREHDRCYGTITNRWQKALQMSKTNGFNHQEKRKDDIVRKEPSPHPWTHTIERSHPPRLLLLFPTECEAVAISQ
jgi:hypothetical protein